MNFKKSTKTLCIFCMVFLFVQCEKKEMFLTEGNQPDAAQNLKAKKDKPPGQDETVYNYATVTNFPGRDWYIRGEGELPDGPFTLELNADYFVNDGGVFYVEGYIGDPRDRTDDDRIRIMYTTKKKGENRIDLWYTDEGVPKCFVIRQSNPNDAYDPKSNTLTFDNAEYCIVAIRDGSGENYTDYSYLLPSAIVTFSYVPPED